MTGTLLRKIWDYGTSSLHLCEVNKSGTPKNAALLSQN
jgi:hypothetical protein